MQHTAFINSDNIIEVHLVGDILAHEAEKLGKETIRLVTELLNQEYHINILADYSRAKNTLYCFTVLSGSPLIMKARTSIVRTFTNPNSFQQTQFNQLC